jgi:hypothetical protein
MKDVHPGPDAGDGKPIQRRTSKPGDPPEGRIECAQCGFFFDSNRDVQGDSGGDGVQAGTEIQSTTVAIAATQANLPHHLRDIATFQASSRDVADPVVTSGCPLCGTLNPTGRYRNSDPFLNGVDHSDQ